MSDGEAPYMESLKDGSIYTSLEVVKNTKGHNWTVKVAGFDLEKVKEQLIETESALSAKYGTQ